MTDPHYRDATPVDSQAAWQELIDWLPGMLERLLDSPVYDRTDRPPNDARGVYLFSKRKSKSKHLYVGRTGITARTRKAATKPGTSFRTRFDQHTRAGSSPASAPFALRLAHAKAAKRGIAKPPGDWWKRREEHADFDGVFTQKKLWIGDELQTRVVAFDDDVLGIRSLVAEAYAHAMLRTPFNDFSPS
jgi:hypothetical protein